MSSPLLGKAVTFSVFPRLWNLLRGWPCSFCLLCFLQEPRPGLGCQQSIGTPIGFPCGSQIPQHPRPLSCSGNPVGPLAQGVSRCISSSSLVLASHVPALPSRLLGEQGLVPSGGRSHSHSFAHIICSRGPTRGEQVVAWGRQAPARSLLLGLSLPLILEEALLGKELGCSQVLLLTSKSPRKAPEPRARWYQSSIPFVPKTNYVPISPLLGKSLGSLRVVMIRVIFTSIMFLGNSSLTNTRCEIPAMSSHGVPLPSTGVGGCVSRSIYVLICHSLYNI